MVSTLDGQQNESHSDHDKELSLDDIAAMVDYRPVNQQVTSQPIPTENQSDTGEDESEGESTLDLDLSTTKTERRLHENPLAKLGVISGVMGVLFFGIGYFLVSTSNFGQRESAEVAEPIPAQETLSPEAAALAAREKELGELKTANALGNQSQALEYQQRQESTLSSRPRAAQSSEDSTQSDEQSPPPSPSTVRPVSEVQSRPVSTTIARPTPRPAPSPARLAQPIRPASVPTTPIPLPTELPRTGASEAPAIDPQARWAELVALGSYGSINYQSSAVQQPNPNADVEELETEGVITASYEPVAVFVSNEKTDEDLLVEESRKERAVSIENLVSSESAGLTEDQQMQSDIDALLGTREIAFEENLYQAIPGERTSGQLLTPVVYSEGAGVSQEVILELTEDLTSGNQVALGAGTQIVAVVSSVDTSGLVTLQVESVILPADSAYTDISLDPNSLQIRGASGEPLMASAYKGDEQEMRNLELDAALIGALGGIGRVLTQPDSESTAIGPSGSIFTTSNGSPNIIGGILDGAAQAVIAPRQERLRQEAAEISQRPNVWYIPAGEDIEVLIADTFVLE